MTISVDPDWWKTLFDQTYLKTDARSVCNEEMTRKEIDLFCRLTPMQPEDPILDLCGGQGRHSVELSQRGFSRCTVLDYSQSLLDIGSRCAKSNNLPLDFVQGDARRLKFASDFFAHVLLLGNSIGYIAQENADLQILVESHRVLQKNGWLLVDVTAGDVVRQNFVPNAWHEIDGDIVVCRQRELGDQRIHVREMVLSKKNGLVRDCNYSIRLYDPRALTDLVAAAGFTNVHLHTDLSSGRSREDLGFMNHRMIVTAQKL